MWRLLVVLILLTAPVGAESPAFHETGHFEPLPPPGAGDWLDTHEEPGQSFEQFLRQDNPRPDRERDTLYLQPLGRSAAALESTADFLHRFYRLDLVIAPPIALTGDTVRGRHSSDDLADALPIPADAFAVVGVTDQPLYAEDVGCCHVLFGEADYGSRVAVVSSAHYEGHRLTERMARVTAHEVGHLFGLRHCTRYRCLMNGSSNLEESDARPLHLCPEDLRKLHHAQPFDPVERYRHLSTWARRHGLDDTADWFRRRTEFLAAR